MHVPNWKRGSLLPITVYFVPFSPLLAPPPMASGEAQGESSGDDEPEEITLAEGRQEHVERVRREATARRAAKAAEQKHAPAWKKPKQMAEEIASDKLSEDILQRAAKKRHHGGRGEGDATAAEESWKERDDNEVDAINESDLEALPKAIKRGSVWVEDVRAAEGAGQETRRAKASSFRDERLRNMRQRSVEMLRRKDREGPSFRFA